MSRGKLIDIEVAFDDKLQRIVTALALLGEGNLPETAKSIDASTDIVLQIWDDTARASFKHSSGAYVKALTTEYPFEDSELVGRALCTHPAAFWIEHGSERFDMKKMLQTSDKVRTSKDGKKYLIIPFEHGTPGTRTMRGAYEIPGSKRGSAGERHGMPANIYKKAKILTPSRITGTFTEPSVQMGRKAEPVMHRKYEWGGRLRAGAGIGRRHVGMVRMARTGGGSKYMTFRVMSENSTGWIHPGIKPMKIAERTRIKATPMIIEMVRAAAKRDVENIQKEMHFAA